MTESQENDGNGLPMPDKDTEAAWRREALAEQPNPKDWADLVVMLRWVVELERRGLALPDLPSGMTAPEYALKAVLIFLDRQPGVMRHTASAPLIKLHGAIVDLADGRVSPLFKPVVRRDGNPGKNQGDAFRMGMAARTMSEYMDGGESEPDAARLVAVAVGEKAATVRNWRARLNEGPGPGAPQVAVDHYRAQLPPGLGATPQVRADNLIKCLKTRGWHLF